MLNSVVTPRISGLNTIAALVCLAALGCGGSRVGGGDGGTDGTVVTGDQLIITSTTTSVDITNGAPVTATFSAKVMHPDGTSDDATSATTFSIDSSYGSFTGPVLSITGPASGMAIIQGSDVALTGTGTITVRVHNSRLDPSAPVGADGMFTGATADPSFAPTVVYPDDQVIMPNNLGSFEVHWNDTQNQVFRVVLASDYADLTVYVGGAAPHFFVFTPDDWNLVTANQAAMTFTVSGASSSRAGTIGSSAPRTAKFTNEPISGGIYYWEIMGDAATGKGSVYRHDMAQPGTPAEAFATPANNGNHCVGCHALSRDGTKMAVTYDGVGPGVIMDVASQSLSPSQTWELATFTADSTGLETAYAGALTLRSAATGAAISSATSPTGGFIADPDISHAGTSIAYTSSPPNQFGQMDEYVVSGASIYTSTFDPTTGALGTPSVLVAADSSTESYYPSWSPDDQWMLFTRSTNDTSYDVASAELWVVNTNGSSPPILLNSANVESGITNSWSRWAPFQQTVGDSSEQMYWITFSSKRDFGNRLVGLHQPQIWMAPFFPDRAAAGMDPTGPAFRVPFQDIATTNHIAQWTEVVVVIGRQQ